MLRVSSVILAKNLPSWLHLRRTQTVQAPPTSQHGAPGPAPGPASLLKDRPVGRALAVKASLLLPGEDVPDDDGLRVVLRVHQGAESHQVPATQVRDTQPPALTEATPPRRRPTWGLAGCGDRPAAPSRPGLGPRLPGPLLGGHPEDQEGGRPRCGGPKRPEAAAGSQGRGAGTAR